MEAVTFAESGEPGLAREVTRRMEQESSKILAVGKSEKFSQETKAYAIQLAKRVGFELVALSICDSEDNDSKQSFQRMSQAEAAAFQAEAAQSGVRFYHVIKSGELNAILKQLLQEIRRIKLVVASSEIGEDKIEGSLELPVFIANRAE